MNENEEMVYSSMGFDPILLLDKPLTSENYRVHIIRPGVTEVLEETNKSLNKNQQKIIDNSNSKQERNNEDAIHLENKNPSKQVSTKSEDKNDVEEKNINVALDEKTNGLINPDHDSSIEKDELISTESQEVNEDPRRKRRRSSASSST